MKPSLYIFAISHYCEKARWALDYLQIDYQLVHLAPGLHLSQTKKLGATASSLPILDTGKELIQGSANIIDWADKATQNSRKLTPDSKRDECLAIEKRLDDIAGVHTRRMFYSEALVEHSSTVRPIFTKDLPLLQRPLITAMWPVVRKKMIRAMDLGFEQGQESESIVDNELTWLDGVLTDGRRFLVADTFSRADITAASLFAPLASPANHPSYALLNIPPRVAATMQDWNERKATHWVRDIYRDYR